MIQAYLLQEGEKGGRVKTGGAANFPWRRIDTMKIDMV